MLKLALTFRCDLPRKIAFCYKLASFVLRRITWLGTRPVPGGKHGFKPAAIKRRAITSLTGYCPLRMFPAVATKKPEMVEAMACASVPRIVLVTNHASGAGYYAMAGQGFDPNFTFSWPTARIGVMVAPPSP